VSATETSADVRALFGQYRRDGEDGAGTGPPLAELNATQVELLAALLELYRREGVVADNEDLPLCLHCGDRNACWTTPPLEDGNGISFPYIGPDYCGGGVVIVGMNMNEAWRLPVEFGITEIAIERLENGWRTMPPWTSVRGRGSPYHYRSTRSARAVLAAQGGEDKLDVTEPQQLVPTLLATARVQAVKCQPGDEHDGRNFAPYPEMYEPCRRRFLEAELGILRPGTILAFGGPVRGLVVHALCDNLEDREDGLFIAELHREWGDARVYSLCHPSARGGQWTRSHERLIEILEDA
jgi:hypothetical protein